jgi:hypothetical protein
MKRKLTLRSKISLKSKLKQRIVIGVSSMLITFTVVGIVYFNFFNNTNSLANQFEDGQVVQDLVLNSVCSEDPSSIRRWKVTNQNNFDVAVEWDVFPNFQSGLMILHKGDNFIFTNTLPGTNTLRIRWQDEELNWKQLLTPSSIETCSSQGCYASEVVSYTPAKRNDGSLIPAANRVASKALGNPEGNETLNYVSLGFGGEIVLRFESAIANGSGNDIAITETTFGNQNCKRYPEKADVFASQDGCHYTYIGQGCQDSQFDLGEMSWAKYIKIKDVSPVNHTYNGEVADGFDLDGITCLHGSAQTESDDGLVFGSAQEVIQYNQGTRKNGSPIHPTRIDPQNALGIPQNDDLAINFVSLGFNGSLTLKFDYAVFNQEGADLWVVETSFGAPDCQTYPETAFFEGSLDGTAWYPMGQVCLDGNLDIGDGVYAIQYVRISERSPMSQFPNSADGYDLDGILVLNENCQPTSNPSGNVNPISEKLKTNSVTTNRIAFYDNNEIPDEIAEIKVGPNPFQDSFKLYYETGNLKEKVQVDIYNYVGQMVHQQALNIPKNTLSIQEINAEHLPRGVYILSVESAGQKQSLKLIKN